MTIPIFVAYFLFTWLYPPAQKFSPLSLIGIFCNWMIRLINGYRLAMFRLSIKVAPYLDRLDKWNHQTRLSNEVFKNEKAINKAMADLINDTEKEKLCRKK